MLKSFNGCVFATLLRISSRNAGWNQRITSKASLCYGSENWTINMRDAQKLEAAQMRFLRPLLGLTRLDRQRNPEPPVQWVPGVKRGSGVTLTTHPHLVPRSRMSRSYTSSPPKRFVVCSGTALAFSLY
jgi:hypothetical protein